MSSSTLTKRELREQRRAERQAAEAAEAAHNRRRRRLWQLGAAAGLALVAVVVAVAVSSSSGTPKTPAPAKSTLFAGIPEHDGVLGDPKAPVTVTEFLDLQCPICAEASKTTLPTLVNDYVRTGKVKLQARTLHFIGADSSRAAQAAAGAQAQGKLWPFVEAFYAAQGQENSGYVTDSLPALRRHGRRRGPGQGGRRHLRRGDDEGGRRGQPAPRQLDPDLRGHQERQDDRDRLGRARRGRAPEGAPVRRVSVLVAAAGLGIAGYLTIVHYAGGEPVCAIAHGCATVQKSHYAELAGVPVALLGLLGYVAILAALARDGERERTLAAFVSLAGFGFSAWLTYVEVARLDAICIWCVGSAICMTLLAGLSAVRLVAAPA